jgi:Cu(I)/Ag(I) efflux system membrane fusion protein
MDVVTGRTSGAYTEILSGLEPGQRVVTSAQYLLDSESNLAEVMKSMIGQMNMSDMKKNGDMEGMSGMDMSGKQGSMSPPMSNEGTEMNAKGATMKGMSMPPAVRSDSAATKDAMRQMKMPPAPIKPRR